MYEAKILLDSISPGGRRLTTWELQYPRFVHAELMTHRLFSRNSASSRAIPNEKLRARVEEDPAMPVFWGKNQSGMQAAEELPDDDCKYFENAWFTDKKVSSREAAKREWLKARNLMLQASENLAAIGLHKQLCNRLIEPWMFITVIVSSTSFDNWFHLRDHKAAQPEIAFIAREMHEKYKVNKPAPLEVGAWHLPLISGADWDEIDALAPRNQPQQFALMKKVSVGRVARVSYLTHDGKRDIREDIALHDRLLSGQATGDPLHMSPFEHIACALEDPNAPSGNFRGWKQYRKEISGEHYGETLP